MEWNEIQIGVSSADTDAAAAIVTMAAPYGISIEDYSDMDEVLPTIGRVDYVDAALLRQDKTRAVIRLYVPENVALGEVTSYLEGLLQAASLPFTMTAVSLGEESWSEAWKRFYKPRRVGGRLVVCPSWETYKRQPGDVVLSMDPGSAFGSGEHETTALCLRLVEKTVRPGFRVLDMGCGSGILSIAALLLGAECAVAVDVDENAVNTARANAAANGIPHDRYQGRWGNVLEDAAFGESLGQGYDLVCANIVADVILAMGETLLCKLCPGGTLLASGIIDSRADEVADALVGLGFVLDERLEQGGWVALRLKKPQE